mmetsp:Transcript_19847/g.55333  ORF Transcript_19847/g.55333 Transcript_19847/m.55333 type:complete len:119 (-) Transcript_19847:355-711(-)
MVWLVTITTTSTTRSKPKKHSFIKLRLEKRREELIFQQVALHNDGKILLHQTAVWHCNYFWSTWHWHLPCQQDELNWEHVVTQNLRCSAATLLLLYMNQQNSKTVQPGLRKCNSKKVI